MSRGLIVTGMHRSGTSLVANFLAKSGLDMGTELLPADVGNRHGYFEDAVIHDFHRRVLRRAGFADAFTVRPHDLPIAPTEPERDEARSIATAAAAREQWGWKEPRTALFLDLWADLIGSAHFLFLIRRPDAVLDSLMRRASNESVVERPAVALDIWLAHNLEMLRFFRQEPQRCTWIDADRFVEQPEVLIDAVRARGFELSPVPLSDVMVASDFHRDVRMRAKSVTKRNKPTWRRCTELYDEILAIAADDSRTHADDTAR